MYGHDSHSNSLYIKYLNKQRVFYPTATKIEWLLYDEVIYLFSYGCALEHKHKILRSNCFDIYLKRPLRASLYYN